MALHTKKAFAEMCGMTTGNLSNYASPDRRKVVYSGDFVDDEIEPNKSFLKKRLERKGKDTPAEPEPAPQPEIKKEVRAPIPHPQKSPRVKDPGFSEGILALDKEKIELQNEKLREEIDWIRKKKEKAEGESLPITSVRALVLLQTEGSKIAWNHATEDWLKKLTLRLQLSREIVAEVKSGMDDIVNEASTRSAQEVKKSLRRLQKEISLKKGKGEHE